MAQTSEFTVPEKLAGERLDRVLPVLMPDLSRSVLQRFIENGLVMVNARTVTQNRFKVASGMKITLERPETVSSAPQQVAAEEFNFEVLYEDDTMLIINKPAGVVVHPAAGVYTGTVANALLSRCPALALNPEGDAMRPGIVHRLDKDTSGCLAAAKTVEAQTALSKKFAERDVDKCYLALAYGHFRIERDRMENYIGRHMVDRQKMAVVDERHGKFASSSYRVLRKGYIGKVPVSLVEVRIYTGRTHQIRVQLANINHPVMGDLTYGNQRVMIKEAPRQLLHAWKLRLGEVFVTAPLPADFEAALAAVSGELQR